jgi:predicted ATPase
MKQTLSEAAIERAVAVAYDYLRERGGMTPHAVIDDLIGLEAYRRYQRCPDSEELAAYAGEALPFDEAVRVAAHENRCPVCRADIEDLRGFVRQQVTQVLAATPAWTTPFVGREAPREALSAALSEDDAPCLTLTASPGTGKTRLVLETAVEQAYRFPDGVWYVAGTNGGDADFVATEIARAAQFPLSPRGAPVDQLQEFFADRRGLLVLDDVRAGSPAAQVMATLAQNGSGLRCLTTGTAPPGVPGEQALALPPMPVPSPEQDVERLLAGDSLQLFLAHVRTFAPDYAPDEPEARAAAAICTRAGGLPLAIELAAAGVREMSPQEMERRMEQRAAPPETFAGTPGNALSDLLAWSYSLLSQRERTLLQRLSVFVDGFFVEQAVAICREEEAPELLERLAQRALLQRLDRLGRARYLLPAPVQAFARQQLGAQNTPMRQRHLAYFLQYAEERAERLTEARQVEAMEEMAADLPNLRAGMDQAQESGTWRAAGGYGLALRRLFWRQGDWQESVERLRRAVTAFENAEEEAGRDQARMALAYGLVYRGGYAEAESLFQSLAEEAEARGALSLLAEARHGLGNVAQFRGQYADAAAHFQEALQQFTTVGDRWNAADCQYNLGWLAAQQGDYARAERLLLASLAVLRERGDRYRIGNALASLGNIALRQNRLEEARRRFEECLQVRQELGDARGVASAIGTMGTVWQALGDTARADYAFAEAARRFERLGDRRDQGQTLAMRGDLARVQGDLRRAREHFEAGLRILETVGDAHRLAEARGGLGRVAEQEGRREEAARLYRESLSQLHALGDTAGVAVLLTRFGRLLAAEGDAERAALLLHRAVALCAQRGLSEQAEAEAARRQIEDQLGAERAAALRPRADALTLAEAVSLVFPDSAERPPA